MGTKQNSRNKIGFAICGNIEKFKNGKNHFLPKLIGWSHIYSYFPRAFKYKFLMKIDIPNKDLQIVIGNN